jgi:hypothetical protein
MVQSCYPFLTQGGHEALPRQVISDHRWHMTLSDDHKLLRRNAGLFERGLNIKKMGVLADNIRCLAQKLKTNPYVHNKSTPDCLTSNRKRRNYENFKIKRYTRIHTRSNETILPGRRLPKL